MTAPVAAAAAGVFALTYAVLGFGSIPPLRIDRAGATLIGATLMVAIGALTPLEAVAAVDLRTLALLFGMMILVAHLRLSGFFHWIAARALRGAHGPRGVLVLTLWLSGAVSAFFVNDTACVLLTPLVLETALALRRDPVPFLLALAMGANLGSVATIVGNPQNMLVASFSGISYAAFALALAPVAIVSLALAGPLLIALHRRALDQPLAVEEAPAPRVPLDRPLLVKSLVVSGLLLVALAAGLPPGLAAMLAASALLVTRRVDPQAVWAGVDWSLLTMFAGLFVVVEGVERAGLTAAWLGIVPEGARRSAGLFAGVTAALSNVVSNVPAVLVLRSWVPHLPDPRVGWLLLAMTSTLAGNLTLVGSVANLIVVEQARGRATIGFRAYARAGVPLTLLTLAIGLAWLLWVGPRLPL